MLDYTCMLQTVPAGMTFERMHEEGCEALHAEAIMGDLEMCNHGHCISNRK